MLLINDTPNKLIFTIALILLLIPIADKPFTKAAVHDNKKAKITDKLNMINRNDRQELDGLASSLRGQGPGHIAALVEIWKTGDDDIAWKAAYILGRLGDDAIGPLLKAGPPDDPLRQVWRLKKLAESSGKYRKAVINELVKGLNNKTYIPAPENGSSIEDPPPEQRICDTVYLHLRNLLNTKEKNQARLNTTYIFRRLEIKDRDLIIKKYQTSGVWVDLVEWETARNDSASEEGLQSHME